VALDLGERYAGLVSYCMQMAMLIDGHPTSTTLRREYRPALLRLIALGDSQPPDDDELDAFLRSVRTPTRGSTS
jgi:hypothetical protein